MRDGHAQVAGTIPGLTVTATTEEALDQAEAALLRQPARAAPTS